MSGASIEATLESWASSPRGVRQTPSLFAQERAGLNAGLFLDGLPGDGRARCLIPAFDGVDRG
jgi:hypothetical protein